jgi:hypothetical protein
MDYKRLLLYIFLLNLLAVNCAFCFEKFHAGHHSYPKLNYDSLFAEAVSVDSAAEGKDLIESCIERYGGVEKLEKLKSFHLGLSMLMIMSNDSITVDKFFVRDRMYKIVRHRPDGIEERILNKSQAWFSGKDTVYALDGGRYNAELFSYLTLSMPLGLKTESFDDTRLGHREDDSLTYLYLKKQDSLMIVLGISPSDFTIRSSEGIVYQDTTTLVFINLFGDFDTFDGYLFPRSLINISMGLEVARSKVSKVLVNPHLESDDFRPRPMKTKPKQDI